MASLAGGCGQANAVRKLKVHQVVRRAGVDERHGQVEDAVLTNLREPRRELIRRYGALVRHALIRRDAEFDLRAGRGVHRQLVYLRFGDGDVAGGE